VAAPPIDMTRLDEAVEIARAAGRESLRWFRSSTLRIETKGDGTPVTEADRAAERFLRAEISRRYPTDTIIGEEEPDHEHNESRHQGTAEYTRELEIDQEHDEPDQTSNRTAIVLEEIRYLFGPGRFSHKALWPGNSDCDALAGIECPRR